MELPLSYETVVTAKAEDQVTGDAFPWSRWQGSERAPHAVCRETSGLL